MTTMIPHRTTAKAAALAVITARAALQTFLMTTARVCPPPPLPYRRRWTTIFLKRGSNGHTTMITVSTIHPIIAAMAVFSTRVTMPAPFVDDGASIELLMIHRHRREKASPLPTHARIAQDGAHTNTPDHHPTDDAVQCIRWHPPPNPPRYSFSHFYSGPLCNCTLSYPIIPSIRYTTIYEVSCSTLNTC